MDDANSTGYLSMMMAMWREGAGVDNAETVAAADPVVEAPKLEPVVERFPRGSARITMDGYWYERGPKVRGRVTRWFVSAINGGAQRRVRNLDTIAELTAIDGKKS